MDESQMLLVLVGVEVEGGSGDVNRIVNAHE